MTQPSATAVARGSLPSADEAFSADAFRGLERGFEVAREQSSADAKAAAIQQQRKRVKELIDEHIDDAKWRELLHRAREAAEHGGKEYQLLRFPSALCTDGSRAINNPPNDSWPETLRGEAAELYARWHDKLRPRGFHIGARVLDFPDGKPGDVGLFLFWGE
jgi:uncharacterized membrane protein